MNKSDAGFYLENNNENNRNKINFKITQPILNFNKMKSISIQIKKSQQDPESIPEKLIIESN